MTLFNSNLIEPYDILIDLGRQVRLVDKFKFIFIYIFLRISEFLTKIKLVKMQILILIIKNSKNILIKNKMTKILKLYYFFEQAI